MAKKKPVNIILILCKKKKNWETSHANFIMIWKPLKEAKAKAKRLFTISSTHRKALRQARRCLMI